MLSAKPPTAEAPSPLVPPLKASPTNRSPVLPCSPLARDSFLPSSPAALAVGSDALRCPLWKSFSRFWFGTVVWSFGKSHKICERQFSHLHLLIFRSSGLGSDVCFPVTATPSLRGWLSACGTMRHEWCAVAFQRRRQGRSLLHPPSL